MSVAQPMTSRELTLEEVAAFAAGLQADELTASKRLVRQDWMNIETLQKISQDKRTYHAYPADNPVCVWAITPATSNLEMDAPALRWLGKLSKVPRSILSSGTVRLRAAEDEYPDIQPFHPVSLTEQWILDFKTEPVMPDGVTITDTASDLARSLWQRFITELEERRIRAEGASPDSIADRLQGAEQEYTEPGFRWLTIGDFAVARSSLLKRVHRPSWQLHPSAPSTAGLRPQVAAGQVGRRVCGRPAAPGVFSGR